MIEKIKDVLWKVVAPLAAIAYAVLYLYRSYRSSVEFAQRAKLEKEKDEYTKKIQSAKESADSAVSEWDKLSNRVSKDPD